MKKRKVGRPSKYTLQLVAPLLQRLALGESLTSICKDPSLPNRDTIYSWVMPWSPQYIKEFSDQYARAREVQMESWQDQIVDISDDGLADFISNEEGKTVIDYEHIQRSRLRVDTRKWLMSKIIPRKYGDKLQQEITGKEGADLIPSITISVKKPNEPKT